MYSFIHGTCNLLSRALYYFGYSVSDYFVKILLIIKDPVIVGQRHPTMSMFITSLSKNPDSTQDREHTSHRFNGPGIDI